MLEREFKEVYAKFKLNFYRGIFERIGERESTLSASESYAAEVIHALGDPTISQFAHFLQISQPNATYKVNTLVKKGYVEKVASPTDRRETLLRTTPRFREYYAINESYLDTVMKRIRKRFTKKEVDQLEQMLHIISTELMPENYDGLKPALHAETALTETEGK